MQTSHKTPNTRWIAGLKEEQATEFKKALRSGDPVLIRLKQIILKEKANVESPKTLTEYDSPSWSHKQADRLGQIRAYENLLTLLEFVDNE